MSEVVCCADLGTTHVKTAFIDGSGRFIALHKLPAPTIGADFEFDAEQYAQTVVQCLGATRRSAPQHAVRRLSLTGQRATIVPLNQRDEPVGEARSWQDGRGMEQLNRLLESIGVDTFSRITGLPPSALWSLTKILSLAAEQPGPARFALLIDYVWRRLGATELVTDQSNASLTGLFDLTELQWSAPLLEAARLERSQLPTVRPAGAEVGQLSEEVARATGLAAGTPLVLGGGDQQCAALGAGACNAGDAALCVGSAAVVSCPTEHPFVDRTGRWFCTAHVLAHRWVVEGIHNTYGSALSWASALLGLAGPAQLEQLAASCAEPWSDVVFLPFLAGIGSPDFNASAAGAFTGLRLGVSRAQLARAVFEGVSLEVRRILETLPPLSIDTLRVVGGASGSLANEVLAQATGRRLALSRAPEASLLGAGLIAWTHAGRFKTVADGAKQWTTNTLRTLSPVASDRVEGSYRRYRTLVQRLLQNGAYR